MTESYLVFAHCEKAVLDFVHFSKKPIGAGRRLDKLSSFEPRVSSWSVYIVWDRLKNHCFVLVHTGWLTDKNILTKQEDDIVNLHVVHFHYHIDVCVRAFKWLLFKLDADN